MSIMTARSEREAGWWKTWITMPPLVFAAAVTACASTSSKKSESRVGQSPPPVRNLTAARTHNEMQHAGPTASGRPQSAAGLFPDGPVAVLKPHEKYFEVVVPVGSTKTFGEETVCLHLGKQFDGCKRAIWRTSEERVAQFELSDLPSDAGEGRPFVEFKWSDYFGNPQATTTPLADESREWLTTFVQERESAKAARETAQAARLQEAQIRRAQVLGERDKLVATACAHAGGTVARSTMYAGRGGIEERAEPDAHARVVSMIYDMGRKVDIECIGSKWAVTYVENTDPQSIEGIIIPPAGEIAFVAIDALVSEAEAKFRRARELLPRIKSARAHGDAKLASEMLAEANEAMRGTDAIDGGGRLKKEYDAEALRVEELSKKQREAEERAASVYSPDRFIESYCHIAERGSKPSAVQSFANIGGNVVPRGLKPGQARLGALDAISPTAERRQLAMRVGRAFEVKAALVMAPERPLRMRALREAVQRLHGRADGLAVMVTGKNDETCEIAAGISTEVFQRAIDAGVFKPGEMPIGEPFRWRGIVLDYVMDDQAFVPVVQITSVETVPPARR